jgi:hypothetical protein
MTTLEEKVKDIIDNVSTEFNDLPFETRKAIHKFTSEMQILTIWQMLNKDKDITTQKWRDKQRKWLENCVEYHLKEWSE